MRAAHSVGVSGWTSRQHEAQHDTAPADADPRRGGFETGALGAVRSRFPRRTRDRQPTRVARATPPGKRLRGVVPSGDSWSRRPSRHSTGDLGEVVATQPKRGLADGRSAGIARCARRTRELRLAEHRPAPRACDAARDRRSSAAPHAPSSGAESELGSTTGARTSERPPAPATVSRPNRHESPDRGEHPPHPSRHGSNSTIATS